MKNANGTKKKLSTPQRTKLFQILKDRFENNMNRHEGLEWQIIQDKLEISEEKLWTLNEMERTGGEPDVVGYAEETDEFIFYDCSAESPAGRRSLCYDRDALESRKKNKPENNVVDMADEMDVELLTEEQYRALQELGHFDSTTSSWLNTPQEVRERGGAIFGDFRYGRVFIYHNGAQSYYAARGFRGSLKI